MTVKHQLAYASFTIYQEVEPPEFWTNYFGVAPDMQRVKGQFPCYTVGPGKQIRSANQPMECR
jgi:hypothetical protein